MILISGTDKKLNASPTSFSDSRRTGMNGAKDLSRLEHEPETTGWQYAVSAGILGWILDAFDFFVVIFLVDTLAAKLHVDKRAIVWTVSISLAMRPIGALIFGALADRFGRRRPLIACVLYSPRSHY